MTRAQLAKTLNLSRTTVSLVLNKRAEHYGVSKETIQRVMDAAQSFNCRANPIARQLAGKRSNAIGVLINTASVADPRLIQKIEMLAARRQLRFIVGHAVGDEEQIRAYLGDFRARGVDALITFHHNHPACRDFIYQELSQAQRVLYFYKPDPEVADPWYVEPDFYEVGRIATQHLLERGRRRIAITGISESAYPIVQARRRGYLDAHREAGVEADPSLFLSHGEQTSSKWSEPLPESASDAIVNELVVRGGADSIVCVTDLEAVCVIGALRRIGKRVPEDVAIIGTDNLGVATLITPRVTNIDLRLDALAEATVELLFEMLGGDGDGIGDGEANRDGDGRSGRGIIVKPELCVRESS